MQASKLSSAFEAEMAVVETVSGVVVKELPLGTGSVALDLMLKAYMAM